MLPGDPAGVGPSDSPSPVFSVIHAGQTYQVFLGNLHSHTSLSDGSSTPRKAFEHARDVAGIDFLAITEHNHRDAPSRIQDDPGLYTTELVDVAGEFDVPGQFVALYGQEFSSIGSGNHANVLD